MWNMHFLISHFKITKISFSLQNNWPINLYIQNVKNTKMDIPLNLWALKTSKNMNFRDFANTFYRGFWSCRLLSIKNDHILYSFWNTYLRCGFHICKSKNTKNNSHTHECMFLCFFVFFITHKINFNVCPREKCVHFVYKMCTHCVFVCFRENTKNIKTSCHTF
jgi:hypothetical protein